METIFILLHKHQKSDNSIWVSLIPVYLFIAGVIVNYFTKMYNHEKDIRIKLSDDLMRVTDKMIRNATSCEFWALEYRYHLAKYEFSGKQRDLEYADYYHHELEKLTGIHDSLRSELKLCVKNLNRYWRNEIEKKELISLMHEIVLTELSSFYTLFKDVKDINKIDEIYLKTRVQIKNDMIFKDDGICFLLVVIQTILDKDSPLLYMGRNREKELYDMVDTYRNSGKNGKRI